MQPALKPQASNLSGQNRRLSADRDLLLHALVMQALNVKASAPAYSVGAVAALIDAWERHQATARLHREIEIDALVQVLRATDPATGRKAAA